MADQSFLDDAEEGEDDTEGMIDLDGDRENFIIVLLVLLELGFLMQRQDVETMKHAG